MAEEGTRREVTDTLLYIYASQGREHCSYNILGFNTILQQYNALVFDSVPHQRVVLLVPSLQVGYIGELRGSPNAHIDFQLDRDVQWVIRSH